MFCKVSKNNENYQVDIDTSITDIIISLSTLCILLSTAITTTIVGIIIKQENEKSNVLLLLPLILLVILNTFHLELNVIRMSIMFLAVGFVIYDFVLLFTSQFIITNIIYLSISSIQLICTIWCII